MQSRTQERLSRIYADSLGRIGIHAIVRLADEVQYERRRQKFDFDMLIAAWIASPSPGYEQRFLWGSQSADEEASYNLAGARSPAIDAMIAAMVAAKTHEEFVDAVRTYDRVLLSGFYIVPLFYAREQCRVDGDVAVPIPRRPGRAELPHPVLHARGSLAAAYPWKILAGGRGWRFRISLRRAHRTTLWRSRRDSHFRHIRTT